MAPEGPGLEQRHLGQRAARCRRRGLARRRAPARRCAFPTLSALALLGIARAIEREQSVSALARRYEMSLTAVQKHVAVLERAALVSKHKSGREQRVAANPEPLREAATLLAAFEQQWIKRATTIAEILAEEDAGT